MSKPTLSLCMIVKNEEKHLAKCLQSVQGTVDEIIIVDTGSTDQTVEIAKHFNANLYHFDWIGDFAAARNFSLEKATSDYILVLDADEHFEGDAHLLLQDITTGKDYYLLRIKNNLNALSTQHLAIRLLRNNSGLKFRGRIHEHLDIDHFPEYTNAVATPLLHHVGYMESTYQEKNKHERNLKLLEQAVRENPNGYNYFNLGRQYQANGEFQNAFDAFKKSFSQSKESIFITTLLNAMVQCLLRLKKYPEGIRLALDSIDSFPLYTDLHFTLGELYHKYGYLHDAERAFQKCLEIGEMELSETTVGVGSFLAHAKMGELYFQQGKRMEAVEAAIRALQIEKKCNAAFEIFLRAMAAANVPIDDIEVQVKRVVPMTSGEDVLNMVTVLYQLRHPLLKRYIDEYDLKVEPALFAVAEQYTGHFEKAREWWSQVEQVQADQVPDLLFLAVRLQNEALFQRCKQVMNISQKEWKLLRKIVMRETVQEEPMLEGVVKLMLLLCEKTMVMREFETFEYVSQFVMRGSVRQQIELARGLHRNGYAETAADLLIRLLQQEPNNAEVYGLLGDICLQLNQLPDALQMYVRLFELNKEFATFERLYNLYEKMQDTASLENLKREIQELFQLSEWVKTF